MNNHGGKRDGAGAKLKFNEPTETISVRVPVSEKEKIKILIDKLIKKYQK